jgi:hypothetical protein
VAKTTVDVKAQGLSTTFDFGKGVGAIAGAGSDIRLARHFSVTPAVDFWAGSLGDVSLAGEPIFSSWKHNVVDLTVGITFE